MHRAMTFSSPLDVARSWSALRRGGGDPTFRRVGRITWRTSRMDSGAVTVSVVQVDSRHVEAEAWGTGADEMLTTLPRALGEDDDPS